MQTKALGIVIVLIGVLMMVYTGFNYFTTKNVVDLGPIQINKVENHPFSWSPYVGLAFLIIGVILMVRSGKKA